jgi:hypothetical protein
MFNVFLIIFLGVLNVGEASPSTLGLLTSIALHHSLSIARANAAPFVIAVSVGLLLTSGLIFLWSAEPKRVAPPFPQATLGAVVSEHGFNNV